MKNKKILVFIPVAIALAFVISINAFAATFTTGSINAGRYTNQYFNISFDIPDDFNVYDNEALASFVNHQAMSDAQAKNFIDGNKTYTALFAENSSYSENVQIAFENKKIKNFNSLDLTYTKNAIQNNLSSMGYSNIVSQERTISLQNKNIRGLKTTAVSKNNRNIYILQAFVEEGDYCLIFTATSFNNDTTASILEKFN